VLHVPSPNAEVVINVHDDVSRRETLDDPPPLSCTPCRSLTVDVDLKSLPRKTPDIGLLVKFVTVEE